MPADATLREGDSIDVDQSALTGESRPVSRKTGDTIYSSSIVRQGEVDATVTGTEQQDLLRQDGQAGRERPHRQPLPARCAEGIANAVIDGMEMFSDGVSSDGRPRSCPSSIHAASGRPGVDSP